MQKFIFPIRVYYEDTDAGGVVYYANYLKFMERARTEWLRKKGYEQDSLIEEQGLLFAVHSISVQYVKPARFNELLYVDLSISQLKRASIVFEQCVFRALESVERDLLTTGVVKVASLDAHTFKPKRLPLELRKDLESAG